MNPYLEGLQERYNGLRTSIEGLQARAVEEERDLTEDELRSVKEMGEQAKTLATQIEDLTEIEQRSRKVAELAAVVEQGKDGEQTRGAAQRVTSLGVTAQERDPGYYTRSSDYSFFGDMYRSRVFQDEVAAQRLLEHQRALTTGTHGPGVVPPNWLTSEFEELARQGRAVANAVRNIPLGDDPRPLTLPKQISGTDDVVAEQTNENDPVAGGGGGAEDAWDSDVDTVTPKPTAGKQIVSRQMLDMSSPAIDQLIYGDLLAVYNTKVEKKVADAILAAGPAALSATGGSSGTFFDVTLDAAVSVRNSRKLPANIAVMSILRYGEFLKLKDGNNRPLVPNPGTGQSVNVIGVGSVAVDGVVHGLGITATDQIADAGTDTDLFAVIRSPDTLLFESNMLRFRFEEQAGPESIVLGIWGYTAALVRQGGKGVQRIQMGT